MENDLYTYQPLQGQDSIRILTLYPGKYNDTLITTLDFVCLNENIKYEAISYVWGDPTRNRAIVCNGKRLHITATLEAILRRLRHEERELELWVDQLCINQDDLEERSQQVKFMNTIFWNTQLVNVWLGDDPENIAKRAFRLLRRLAADFKDSRKLEEFTRAQNDNIDDFSYEEWRPLAELLKRPWFRRVWIPQEIGTNAPAVLYWGSESIEWQTVWEVAWVMEVYRTMFPLRLDIDFHAVVYLYKRYLTRNEGGNTACTTFAKELYQSRLRAATDPRDHVFALLGHYTARSRVTGSPIIEADYSRSLSAINLEVATRLLQESDDLKVLNYVDSMGRISGNLKAIPSSHSDETPSWVPTWHDGLYVLAIIPFNSRAGSMGYSKPRIQFTDPKTLVAEGFYIDTIISSPFHFIRRGPSAFMNPAMIFGHFDAEERDLLRSAWTFLCGKDDFDTTVTKYLNGETAITAFFQVLSAGYRYTPYTIMKEELDQAGPIESSLYIRLQKACMRDGAAYLARCLGDTDVAYLDLQNMCQEGGNTAGWQQSCSSVIYNRELFRTHDGYWGLGPGTAEAGDVICVLYGGKTPYCLRPVNDHYILIGECYVHGLMNNEALGLIDEGKILPGTFSIR